MTLHLGLEEVKETVQLSPKLSTPTKVCLFVCDGDENGEHRKDDLLCWAPGGEAVSRGFAATPGG